MSGVTPEQPPLQLGTRSSRLALWQSEHVAARLADAWPGLACHLERYQTEGDKTLHLPLPQIGGKGLFTEALESALRAEAIDLAVHSLKDLPIDDASGLVLGAILPRADVRDVLVGRPLADLPQGARVGTSSRRRAAQLLAVRPDLEITSIRGNVETRIRKVREGGYDATLLALAGLQRLGLDEEIAEILPLATMLPAPGQGALAVQCRADDTATLALLEALNDPVTRGCVTAERAFLHGLGGGCSSPVAAHATEDGAGRYTLTALVAALDGTVIVRVQGAGTDPQSLGERLADQAMLEGAEDLLAHD